MICRHHRSPPVGNWICADVTKRLLYTRIAAISIAGTNHVDLRRSGSLHLKKVGPLFERYGNTSVRFKRNTLVSLVLVVAMTIGPGVPQGQRVCTPNSCQAAAHHCSCCMARASDDAPRQFAAPSCCSQKQATHSPNTATSPKPESDRPVCNCNHDGSPVSPSPSPERRPDVRAAATTSSNQTPAPVDSGAILLGAFNGASFDRGWVAMTHCRRQALLNTWQS